MAFGNGIKLTSELRRALERATAVLDNQTRIVQALARAESELPAANSAVETALERLGSAEADSVLQASPSSTDAAQREVRKARDAADTLKARIGGLGRKLAALGDEVLAAADELKVAGKQWRDECIAGFEVEYKLAAETFGATIRRGMALAAGLGRSQVAQNLKATHIPDLRSSTTNIIRVEGKRRPELSSYAPAWEGDAKATAIFDAHSPVLAQSTAIERAAEAIRTLRAHEEEARRAAEPRSQTAREPRYWDDSMAAPHINSLTGPQYQEYIARRRANQSTPPVSEIAAIT